jgi:hypothetical protein
VVTTDSPPPGYVGEPYSYQLEATNHPTGWVSGPDIGIAQPPWPGGLTISPTTGLLSGTPTTVQTQMFGVEATNSAGTGPERWLTVTISEPTEPVYNSGAVIVDETSSGAFVVGDTVAVNPSAWSWS